MIRTLSTLDKIILNLDLALKTVCAARIAARGNPSLHQADSELTPEQQKQSAALMRVNHAGEISAQALYQGQAITARDPSIVAALRRAASEENDHLAWCQDRLTELHSHRSYLTPAWYLGSLFIGIVAGLAGDHINLGFLVETEHQVVKHLQQHLQMIAEEDYKSRAILQQMAADEMQHATTAMQAGAIELPGIVKLMMKACSKVMTSVAYYI